MIELNPEQTLVYAMYQAYAYNRDLGISPEGFIKMGWHPENVEVMEQHYQKELH